jgi:hypothetical protein
MVRVPTFQRQYVWTTKDVRELFDSIYRGFPVGTLLFWRHHGEAGQVNLGPLKISVEDEPNALWVVDGQQRVISLFGALSNDHVGFDERFEIYFDLNTQKIATMKRGVIPPRSIPIREALETRTLLHWLRDNSDRLEPQDFDVADKLGAAIRDYRVPVYIIEGDNQTLLREVFDRVNSAGRPIKRAQVFHALFASAEQPGSPASVISELRSLHFGDFDENRVVQSLLALRGGDVQRDLHEEFDAGDGDVDDPAEWYDLTAVALTRVIEFLRSEGVGHLLLLPNTLPVPVLAAFFHLHPDPEPWVLRLLSRWLWRGWVHGYGREGGQTPVMRRAIKSVYPTFRKPDDAPSAYEAVRSLLEYASDREVSEVDLTNFRTNFGDTRLILLALASLRPKRADGTEIDLTNELAMHGVEAITVVLPDHPRTNGANRSFWPLNSSTSIDEASTDVLVSHAISPIAAAHLRAGRAEQFLEARSSDLAEFVKGFLSSRLEHGALVRPPLRDLLVAGLAEDE